MQRFEWIATFIRRYEINSAIKAHTKPDANEVELIGCLLKSMNRLASSHAGSTCRCVRIGTCVHDAARPASETRPVSVPPALKLWRLLRSLYDSHTEMLPRVVSASHSFTTSDLAVLPKQTSKKQTTNTFTSW